jgi:uncharacterized protein (DUF427 family)
VTLTVGTGPFGHRPTGVFSAPMPDLEGLMYWDRVPQRVRARFAGETIVDSTAAKLLHEHGRLPIYYFPEGDVLPEALAPRDRTESSPHKGDATYWSVQVGDRRAENAVWGYPEPPSSAAFLAGHRALVWDAMDEWIEEGEPVIVHPRDPFHRIEVLRSSRHVRVSIEGEVVAESRRCMALFETTLPTRWYIPPDDVRSECLVESDHVTGCAYKGFASHWSVRAGGVEEIDVVWSYPEPRHEAEAVAGMFAFYDERVDLDLDGERQERPQTPWSRGRRKPLG